MKPHINLINVKPKHAKNEMVKYPTHVIKQNSKK